MHWNYKFKGHLLEFQEEYKEWLKKGKRCCFLRCNGLKESS